MEISDIWPFIMDKKSTEDATILINIRFRAYSTRNLTIFLLAKFCAGNFLRATFFGHFPLGKFLIGFLSPFKSILLYYFSHYVLRYALLIKRASISLSPKQLKIQNSVKNFQVSLLNQRAFPMGSRNTKLGHRPVRSNLGHTLHNLFHSRKRHENNEQHTRTNASKLFTKRWKHAATQFLYSHPHKRREVVVSFLCGCGNVGVEIELLFAIRAVKVLALTTKRLHR